MPLEELDRYLRDHRTGDVRYFDPRHFDLLYDLTASVGDSGGEIKVICGYRTPWSNEFLRTRRAHTGVAQHSLHMQAEAIDIRLPGIPTSELLEAALHLHRGGVGYYRSSDLAHVDVGRAPPMVVLPSCVFAKMPSSEDEIRLKQINSELSSVLYKEGDIDAELAAESLAQAIPDILRKNEDL